MSSAGSREAHQRLRLGDLLVQDGVLTPEQLARGIEEQKSYGGRLGRHLVDLGIVDEHALLNALSRQLHIPVIDLEAPGAVQPESARYCRGDVAERLGFCPIAVDVKAKVLTVAVADPEPQTLRDIETLTGMRIDPRLATLDAVDRVTRQLYEAELAPVAPLQGLQLSRAELRNNAVLEAALGSPAPLGPGSPVAPPYPDPRQQQRQQMQQQQELLRLQQMMQGSPGYGMPLPPSGPPLPMGLGYPSAYPEPSYSPYAPPPAEWTPARQRVDQPSRVAPLLPVPRQPTAAELAEQVRHLTGLVASQSRTLRILVELLEEQGLISTGEFSRRQQERSRKPRK